MRLKHGVAIVAIVAVSAVLGGTAGADVWDENLNADNGPGTRNELIHGSDQAHDLAARPGPVADDDWYRIAQCPYCSYEVLVDSVSGDFGSTGPSVELVLSDGTVVESSSPVGIGGARSLRWQNATAGIVTDQYVRVFSGTCSSGCGPDDGYRIRAFDTTYAIARFNNSGTQVTVILLQNPVARDVAGELHFWSVTGAHLATQPFTTTPQGTYVLNTSALPALAGQSGSVTVTHDARYGELSGKSVALEPATGFSFDTPMQPRGEPRSAPAAAVGGAPPCAAPRVVSATATSATTVVVAFDQPLDAGSVAANGAQFVFDNGLAASFASASGDEVLVTTNVQSPATTYFVSVMTTVTAACGAPLDAGFNTASFEAYEPPAVVRINELNANMVGPCDLVELRVVSGGSMGRFKLRERLGGTIVLFPSTFQVATNDIVVVHLTSGTLFCNPSGATQEVLSPTQQPAASFTGNFDTAYDFWSSRTGLFNTNTVLTLYDGNDAIVDAVLAADAPTGATASDTADQAALVAAAGQWQIVGGGVPFGGFVGDDFRAHAVLDLNATGTSVSGTSIQRLDNTDDDDKDDWTTGAGAVSTWGVLNIGQTPF